MGTHILEYLLRCPLFSRPGLGDTVVVEGSWASTPAVRNVMRANRSRDTRPELAVRRLVHAAGLRYRVDHPPLADYKRLRADVVFRRERVAVFVDGCFWHGCPEHHRPAVTNAEFWSTKIEGNRRRDTQTDELLDQAGWFVMRFWEHESPDNVASRIIDEIRRRR